jgi:hypothetical protein
MAPSGGRPKSASSYKHSSRFVQFVSPGFGEIDLQDVAPRVGTPPTPLGRRVEPEPRRCTMSGLWIPLLVGMALAAAWARRVRRTRAANRLPMHAGMLLFTAMLYVLFAAMGGAWTGLGVELVGVVLFGGVALLGLYRRSTALLVLGWALHPVWDVALHTAGIMEAYTPEGYVVACIGFDLLLALLIARGAAGLRLAISASAA